MDPPREEEHKPTVDELSHEAEETRRDAVGEDKASNALGSDKASSE